MSDTVSVREADLQLFIDNYRDLTRMVANPDADSHELGILVKETDMAVARLQEQIEE